ncbi:MAG: DUF58 domain-containing protein, partial [Actinomycetota bacterium]|nr:DUF58 domain-containing protein [Actinomycetota bacterium]
MTERGTRPALVARPALVLAALAAAFFAISRTTGSGWVTVLLCAVLACLVAATVWPFVVLRRADLTVTGPGDGTVGHPLSMVLAVRSGTGLRVRSLEPLSEWSSADAPAAGELTAEPARRGVLGAVMVEVRTATPLGLFWWRRVVRAPLGVPLEVGPRRIAASLEELAAAGPSALVETLGARAGHDTVRSVRTYQPGDPARLVHWPATARWGEVMVRELEDPEVSRLAVVVDMRVGGERAETAASRAAGMAEAALAQGLAVWLLTSERGGGVVG